MTSNRARAYAHVMALIGELGPAKLHADEQQAIRDAADALVFSADVASDLEAQGALGHLQDVTERLVEGDRLLPETAESIIDAVEACGPRTEVLDLPAVA